MSVEPHGAGIVGQPHHNRQPGGRPRTITFRGRAVGQVDGEGVFWRRVQAKHVLRQPPAIALHVEVLDALDAAGVEAVAYQLDDGAILTGPLSLYASRGFDVNRGFGAQRAVLVADFLRVDVEAASPEAARAFLDSLT